MKRLKHLGYYASYIFKLFLALVCGGLYDWERVQQEHEYKRMLDKDNK